MTQKKNAAAKSPPQPAASARIARNPRSDRHGIALATESRSESHEQQSSQKNRPSARQHDISAGCRRLQSNNNSRSQPRRRPKDRQHALPVKLSRSGCATALARADPRGQSTAFCTPIRASRTRTSFRRSGSACIEKHSVHGARPRSCRKTELRLKNPLTPERWSSDRSSSLYAAWPFTGCHPRG